MADAPDIAARLRNACVKVRRQAMPLADLIPLLQQAADALSATPSPPVAAPATPVAPSGWGISPFLPRAVPVPIRPWFEQLWKDVNGNDMPHNGSNLLRFAHAIFEAAAQPQPQPAQPLTGARPERCPSCRNGDLYSCTCPFPTSRNAGPPHPDTAQPLTADQRQDLLAAAFYIACRDETGATLKDVDAERIADLLTELSGFDLDSITAPSTPTPEVAP